MKYFVYDDDMNSPRATVGKGVEFCEYEFEWAGQKWFKVNNFNGKYFTELKEEYSILEQLGKPGNEGALREYYEYLKNEFYDELLTS